MSLDKYELPSISPASKKPVMIFLLLAVGLKGEIRRIKDIFPYFEFLARNGFVVVSTDYRTTLKNLDPSKVSSPMDLYRSLAACDRYGGRGFL